MIHKFSLKNFYSFKDENEVSFVVDKNAPKTNSYIKSAFDVRINKTAAVLGANASGKTNLLRALPFLSWFIRDSFSLKPNKTIYYNEVVNVEQFLFTKNDTNPINISVQFEIEKEVYKYNLCFATDRVVFEELRIKKEKRFNKLFKREWEKRNKKYDFELSNYKLPTDFEKVLKDDASVISTANMFGHQLSVKIVKYWNNLIFNIAEFFEQSDYNLYNAAEFFYGNSKAKEKADKLLLQFNLGLNKIEIRELKHKNSKEKNFYIPVGLHKIKNIEKKFFLPLFRESRGTQNLFSLLEPILKVLDSGGMLVLDEFDADLHPQMIPELVNLFNSKIYNPKNAQLLFSTHSLQILNELDKYQIFFTEKGDDGASEVWRLDDIKGVRPDDNYYAKYISGAYGAVPNI